MNTIEKDLEIANSMINKRHKNSCSDAIYFKTNEKLNKLFETIDFKNKKVLSVAASGDQVFHSFNNGAEAVDMFDINSLTKYYLMLRMWNIEYFDNYYLSQDYIYEDIKKILERAIPITEDEKLAYEFWTGIITKYLSFQIPNLFFIGSYNNPYINIDNLDNLRKKIEKKEGKFYCVDISSKDCEINDKYDIIITSNISEYFPTDRNRLINYRNNLYRLVKQGGVVLSSRFFNYILDKMEMEVFTELFDRTELPEYNIRGYNESPGYVYRKR